MASASSSQITADHVRQAMLRVPLIPTASKQGTPNLEAIAELASKVGNSSPPQYHVNEVEKLYGCKKTCLAAGLAAAYLRQSVAKLEEYLVQVYGNFVTLPPTFHFLFIAKQRSEWDIVCQAVRLLVELASGGVRATGNTTDSLGDALITERWFLVLQRATKLLGPICDAILDLAYGARQEEAEEAYVLTHVSSSLRLEIDDPAVVSGSRGTPFTITRVPRTNLVLLSVAFTDCLETSGYVHVVPGLNLEIVSAPSSLSSSSSSASSLSSTKKGTTAPAGKSPAVPPQQTKSGAAGKNSKQEHTRTKGSKTQPEAVVEKTTRDIGLLELSREKPALQLCFEWVELGSEEVLFYAAGQHGVCLGMADGNPRIVVVENAKSQAFRMQVTPREDWDCEGCTRDCSETHNCAVWNEDCRFYCFTGDCRLWREDGSLIDVSEAKVGDCVRVFGGGVDRIEACVRTELPAAKELVRLPNGVRLTGGHPVMVTQAGELLTEHSCSADLSHQWVRPRHLFVPQLMRDVHAVSNFVLEGRGALFVAGPLSSECNDQPEFAVCGSLGQHCPNVDDDLSFFGSERVVNSLKENIQWPTICSGLSR